MQKVLVSDYDNTLYTSDEQIKKNIEKINEFINRGNLFVIATGRSYIDISKMIMKYNIPFNYLICNDGGTIFNNNGKLLYKKDIDLLTAQSIFKDLEVKNLLDITFIDTGYDYSKKIENEVNAIIIKEIDSAFSKNLLVELTSKYSNIHGYISDNWINITEKSVTKTNGILFLKSLLNFEKIYTIGDTINDINMINEFNGACMKNSTKDLLKVCNIKFNSVADYIDYIESREQR